MTELSSVTVKATIMLSFVAGFMLGYKAKEWKIKWMKWRRDKLATKLAETQKKLEIMISA
jgi:hypothetical protein